MAGLLRKHGAGPPAARIVGALLLWMPAATPAAAAEAARAFVGDLLEQSRLIGASPEPEARKAERYRAVVARNFRVAAFGEFAAGAHWRAMTADQRKRYLDSLGRMAVTRVAAGLLRRGVARYTITEVRPIAGRDWLVGSVLTDRAARETTVLWRVRRLSDGLGVVDVLPNGASLAITYRSEFASYMRREGATLEGLVAELHERALRADGAPARGGR